MNDANEKYGFYCMIYQSARPDCKASWRYRALNMSKSF